MLNSKGRQNAQIRAQRLISHITQNKVSATESVIKETEDNTSFRNAASLIAISQMRGSTRSFAVFRKYFIEKCGLTEKQVSILHAISVVSQTIGFFTANQVSRFTGLKNSALLGSTTLALGLTGSGLAVLHSKSPLNWLAICLSIIASSSSGFIERTAYRSIVENYFEHGKLFLSVYLSLSTVSHVWISFLYSFLLEKFGLAPTFFIGGALVFATIPLLSFLSVKELFGEKAQKVTPKLKVSLAQILKKFLTDVKFISYIVVLLVVCSTRSMLHSQGSYILEKVLKVSPTKAALISDGLGSIIPFFTRIFFGSMLRNSYVMELTTSILSIHMGGLLLMMLTENKYIFSGAMVLLQSCVGLVHPLGHSFKNSLDPVDRKAFNQLQTFVTMLGSCMPIWTEMINEHLKISPENSRKTTLGMYLLINIMATWCILLA